MTSRNNNNQSHKYVELVAIQVVKFQVMIVAFWPSITVSMMQGLSPQVQKADIWRGVCKCYAKVNNLPLVSFVILTPENGINRLV